MEKSRAEKHYQKGCCSHNHGHGHAPYIKGGFTLGPRPKKIQDPKALKRPYFCIQDWFLDPWEVNSYGGRQNLTHKKWCHISATLRFLRFFFPSIPWTWTLNVNFLGPMFCRRPIESLGFLSLFSLGPGVHSKTHSTDRLHSRSCSANFNGNLEPSGA